MAQVVEGAKKQFNLDVTADRLSFPHTEGDAIKTLGAHIAHITYPEVPTPLELKVNVVKR